MRGELGRGGVGWGCQSLGPRVILWTESSLSWWGSVSARFPLFFRQKLLPCHRRLKSADLSLRKRLLGLAKRTESSVLHCSLARSPTAVAERRQQRLLSEKHWRADRGASLYIVAHCVSGPLSQAFVGYEKR